MLIEYESPSKLILPVGVESLPGFSKLVKQCAYEDKRITYQYLNWKKVQKQDDLWQQRGCTDRRHWFFKSNSRQDLDAKVAELDRQRHGTVLLHENGRYKIYSGLLSMVKEHLKIPVVCNHHISASSWRPVMWDHEPFPMRWYQEQADKLLCPEDGSRTHGSVSMGTGTGKSLVMANIARRVGLPTVVVVPTLSIAEQMLTNFQRWFGRGKVGQFFDGKKQSNKLFLVAVSNSLANVKRGDEHWNNLNSRKMILVDECHLTPPDSLSTVMFDLLGNVPYRYFFSGTCFRNDGLDTLLRAIVGDTVFELTVAQGINEGFLSPLKFYQWRVKSNSNLFPDDVLKLNKLHLHQNAEVYRHAANLANRAVAEKNRRVLVLVDTVDQYKRLLDGGLKVPSMFAHGPLTAANRDTVPNDQWKFEPSDLVSRFDNGEFPVLVGTSCIGIGTDIKSADFLINIVGLTSEIEISQGVGRGTRLFPGKSNCIYNDYWVYNLPKTDKSGSYSALDRHAETRRKIFDSIYGTCQVMEDR